MKIKRGFRILKLCLILAPMVTIPIMSTRIENKVTRAKRNVVTKIPKVGFWNQVSSSNINIGQGGTIFQTQNGDLYTMGNSAGLQVLKGGALTGRNGFEAAPGTVIIDGYRGTIFQARNGDLYAMGYNKGLQVLKGGVLTGEERFETAPGTSITKGQYGTIFQARNGDLYAMGDTGFEVLKGGELTSEKEFEKAPGTNITKGHNGTIFQAQNGDLYAKGWDTRLQVLKGGALTGGRKFENAPGKTIIKGADGTIFQARNGDLYAMGFYTGLQVLKGGALTGGRKFEDAPGTNITKGGYGTIFQAQNGDLYAMGLYTGLQVLKGGALTGGRKFEDAPGTNIIEGQYGTIFQARNDDLYAMGFNTGLQILKGGALTGGRKFEGVPGTIINKGQKGTIFQSQNDDLYVMGYNKKLQVLKGGILTSENQFINAPGTKIIKGHYGTIFQAQNDDLYAMAHRTGLEVLKNQLKFIKTNEIILNGNDGTITITNFENDYSKLQYRKVGEETWIDLLPTGIIQGLSPGRYQFQWQSKNGAHYVGTTSETQVISGFQEILAYGPKLVANAIVKFESIYSGGLKARKINDDNLDSNLITGKGFSLPSELVGTITTDKLGFTEPSPLTGVTVTYSISSHDDTTGMIVVQAIIALRSDSTTSTTVYFKLSGYQITTQRNAQNQKAINDVASWFKEVGENRLNAKDDKGDIITSFNASKSDILPSEISAPSESDLGIQSLIGSNVNNVIVAYAVDEGDANDHDGTIIIKATISKEKATPQVVYFKLSGYQTTRQRAVQNQKAIEDTFNIINSASSANYNGSILEAITDWTLFLSKTFGIDTSTIPEGVVIKYKHPIINKDDVFVISFHISKGLISKEFTKEINATIKDKSSNAVILGTTIPIGIIFLAGITYLIFRKMKKKKV